MWTKQNGKKNKIQNPEQNTDVFSVLGTGLSTMPRYHAGSGLFIHNAVKYKSKKFSIFFGRPSELLPFVYILIAKEGPPGHEAIHKQPFYDSNQSSITSPFILF